ncbi:hypothetical protein [Rubrimonas sp.]|uniref:hypothetical protein n=1 Tax=Rubrimonas sp. TaxID=2036015 RepID=UPI002FDD60DE
MSKERWFLPENLDAPVAEIVLSPRRKSRGETERLESGERPRHRPAEPCHGE